MYDAFQARQNDEDFDVFTLDDVDQTFEMFVQLKYSQHVPLEGMKILSLLKGRDKSFRCLFHSLVFAGKAEGIEITPYPSGHVIGGTIWKIVKETEEIIYAVDYNHKKERHLNPTVLETLTRPSLLITDAYNALTRHPSRKERDQQLFSKYSIHYILFVQLRLLLELR